MPDRKVRPGTLYCRRPAVFAFAAHTPTMWLLYQVALALVLAIAAPFLLLRRGRHYLATLPGRLGRGPGEMPPGGDGGSEPGAPDGLPLWLHAVSVGEAGVAATVARALPAELPLLVTTITPTGQERARTAFAGRARVAYLPFDLGFAVRRFFARFRPRGLVLVEGDYWPLVLRTARRRRLPVAVVNARVGDASYRRMRRLQPLLGGFLRRSLFGAVDRFGVQSGADRERLIALGVDAERITVTGNLKFESREPPRHPELEAWIGELAGDRPVLVAGSTMEGEEEQVLAAFRAAGGGERALLVLAPRHPERWEGVAQRLAGSGLAHLRRSAAGPGAGGAGTSGRAAGASGESGRADAVLLDSLGELAGLYRLATLAFVGGTLVPTGGHNPVEPARFGVPITVGPSMENFRQIAAEFDRAEAWGRAVDGDALGTLWRRWLDEPPVRRAVGERAAALVKANRGALDRTLELLRATFGAGLGGGLGGDEGPAEAER